MKPATFDYHAPTSLDEAIDLLGEIDDVKLLAGGQSLIPILALRLSRFDALVDLGRIDALRGITSDDHSVTIGAMTTQADVGADATVAACVPLLTAATPLIGHFQIRNRGTIGGSIAHADPAAEYPAVALALDAEVEVAGPSGRRTIPAAELFQGTWTTAVSDDEILVAARFPVWGGSTGFAIEEMARRHGDFALAGACVGVQVENDTVSRCAISLFGVGPTAVRATDAEATTVGSSVTALDAAAVGRLATEGLVPTDDLHASGALRRSAAAALVERALLRAVETARA